MKTYNILKNGFSIGQARGKFKAINMIKKYVEKEEIFWGSFLHGDMTVLVGKDLFTITENKGDLWNLVNVHYVMNGKIVG